jgi:hypothetical protein
MGWRRRRIDASKEDGAFSKVSDAPGKVRAADAVRSPHVTEHFEKRA